MNRTASWNGFGQTRPHSSVADVLLVSEARELLLVEIGHGVIR